MARVPVYGEPRVRVQGAPDARVQAHTTSRGFDALAAGVGAVNQVAQDIAIQERDKAQQMRLQQHQQQVDEAITGLNDRIEKARGEPALALGDSVLPDFDQIVGKLMPTVPDRLRPQFEDYTHRQKTMLERRLNQHINSEARQVDRATTESRVENALLRLQNNPTDPLTVMNEMSIIGETLRGFHAREGASQEQMTAAVNAGMSMGHLATIKALVDQDADMHAEAYYKEMKDQLVGRDREQAKTIVESGSIRAESQRIVDDLMDRIASGEITREQAEREIRALAERNPRLRDEVRQRFDQEQTRFRAREAQQDSDTFEDVSRLIAQFQQEFPGIPVQMQDLVKPSQFLEMSDRTRDALSSRIAQANKTQPIERTRENMVAFDNLLEIIDHRQIDGIPITRMHIHALAAHGRLTLDQTQKALSYYSDGGQLKGLSRSMVASAVSDLTKVAPGKALEKYPGLFDQVADRLEPGKAPTESDVRRIVAGLLRSGVNPAAWWGSTPLTTALEDGSLEQGRWNPEMTEQDRQRIEQRLVSDGRTIDRSMVRNYFRYAPEIFGGLGLPPPHGFTWEQAVYGESFEDERR